MGAAREGREARRRGVERDIKISEVMIYMCGYIGIIDGGLLKVREYTKLGRNFGLNEPVSSTTTYETPFDLPEASRSLRIPIGKRTEKHAR